MTSRRARDTGATRPPPPPCGCPLPGAAWSTFHVPITLAPICGAAGIMFKSGGVNDPAGRALIDTLNVCQHRGSDPTGFALYGDALDGKLCLRYKVFVAGDGAFGTGVLRRKDPAARHRARGSALGDPGHCRRHRHPPNGDAGA